MPALTYSVSDFQAFTKILSADVNTRFSDISTLLNTTKLDDDNIQDDGITRSSKLIAGTADYVLINDGSGDMSEEAQLATVRGGTGQDFSTLTGKAGQAVTVNSGETAFELGTPAVDRLAGFSNSDITGLTAGETISDRDAVCFALNEGEYRVFKCDGNVNNRRNRFVGFAKAAATVTAGVYTWTNNAALTASDDATYNINGRSYSTVWNTSNNQTMTDLATAILGDADVAGAVASDVGSVGFFNTITVTGQGGLTVNITLDSTGTPGSNPPTWAGGSAPTVAMAETTAAAGGGVNIQTFYQLDGFTSLTPGKIYYLSDTAGEITTTAGSLGPIRVGVALTSTDLLVTGGFDNNWAIQDGSAIFIKTGGTTSTAAATAQTNTEHWSSTAWAAGAAISVASGHYGNGEGTIGGKAMLIGGVNTSDAALDTTQTYDKSSWSAENVLPAVRNSGGVASRTSANKLELMGGSASFIGGTGQDDIYSFDGTTWSTTGSLLTNNCRNPGVFAINAENKSHVAGYTDNSTAYSNHDVWDGSSKSTATALPASGCGWTGSESVGGKGIVHSSLGTSNAYEWSGSWSSAITATYALHTGAYSASALGAGQASGNFSGSGTSFTNGQNNGGTAAGVSMSYNGSSYSSETASSTARTGVGGGMAD